MKKTLIRIVVVAAAIGLGIFIRGLMPSGGPPPGMMMGGMPPPAVMVQELSEVPLDVRDEYIAMVEPVQDVMVQTEVSGYIDQVHFKEGSTVKEGDLLFTINQREYLALVNVRQAELERAEAEVDRANKYIDRLRRASKRSVSDTDIETAESAQLQASALLQQAKANLELAQVDLDYSEIRSPISGLIGSALVTKGNYVSPSSGALARIIQTDPIRVVFSMTDRAYLTVRQQVLDGDDSVLEAQVRLPNGQLLPMTGQADFVDNMMSASTGTMAIRYLFNNPDGMLVSGGYVKIMLGQPDRPMGIRIPQRAVLVDPQGSYVLTADAEGMVGTARIETGKSVETDLVVLSGLNAGDRVIVDGIQKVQPGMTAQVSLLENNE
jgi:RND family efflux transporter MFP subunit